MLASVDLVGQLNDMAQTFVWGRTLTKLLSASKEALKYLMTVAGSGMLLKSPGRVRLGEVGFSLSRYDRGDPVTMGDWDIVISALALSFLCI